MALLSIEKKIQNSILKTKIERILFPENFARFGSVDAVRQALHRLEVSQFLVRLAHGIYLYPKHDKVLGILYPTVEEIAMAIAKRDKARIIATGAQAMNKLGLSTQIPMNVVFLTDGAPRTIKVGKRTIKFKKTSPKMLAIQSEVCGMAIQALREIGIDNVTSEQLNKIEEALKIEKAELIIHDARLAPAWIAQILMSFITKH